MELDTTNQQPVPGQTSPQLPIQNFITSQRGFIHLIIGFVILIMIVTGGAYYLGTQKNQTNSLNFETTETQSTPTPLPTTKAQPTDSAITNSPTPKNGSKVGWQIYIDRSYGYTIQYPSGWILKQDKDAEGDAMIKLTATNATKAQFSVRMLPELYISIRSPYSTSGAVCANQSCVETSPLEVKIKGNDLVIPITKGGVMQGSKIQLDFYAFSFPLPGKKISLPNYTEPVELNAISSYRTVDEGKTIADILSTISY